MISITKASDVPVFSSIVNSGAVSSVILSETGILIEKELEYVKYHYNHIRFYDHVIMPDHIHILMYVAQRIPLHMGEYVGKFKGRCSSRWDMIRNDGVRKSLFEKGFHDRIVWRKGQKEIIKRYIASNPHRYFVKKTHPDVFQKYLHLTINGREYAGYGNIFLLRDIDRVAVSVHRAWTDKMKADMSEYWLRCADNEGVLVSPFISKDEKKIRDKGIALGGSIIEIRKEGFPERFKPMGRMFELCAEGRLLMLAPWPDNKGKVQVSRNECLQMNEFALEISREPLELSIRRE